MTVESPPSEEQLKQGLLTASHMFIKETPMIHCVGENGLVTVTVLMLLESGRPRWAKGSAHFERKFTL